MHLKINSKKTSKKVRDKFACTEKSRTFAPAFGKEARRRAGGKKPYFCTRFRKGSPAASRVLDKKPCREFGEEKNPPYLCNRFPLSSGACGI